MIEFQKVRFKNFGSFGNYFSELVLNNHKTTLVTGTNGNGKSFALLDSLCFGLFGKPFRPINIPQLVNSVNGKNCLVEIEFAKAGSQFLIRRGLSPKIFEIFKDGVLVDQNAKSKDYQAYLEEHILGFDYSAFKQVVILGKSNFVPFMQLTPAERRKIIEGLLDIDILADMGQFVKTKLTTIRQQISEQEGLVRVAHAKIKSQEDVLVQVQKNNENAVADLESSIFTLQSESTVATCQVDSLRSIGDVYKSSVAETQAKYNNLKNVPALFAKLKAEIDVIQRDIQSIVNTKVCTCCGQALPEDQQKKHLDEKVQRHKALQDAMVIAEQKQAEHTKAQEELRQAEEQVVLNQNALKDTQHHRAMLQTKIDMLTSQRHKHIDPEEINVYKSKIREAIEEKDALQFDLQTLISEQIHHDVVLDILKDGGLKSRIIKHYVPIINTQVNKFLGKLNLYVDFMIDDEFKETIKSRYRDAFSYSSFSEGEKQRIDLAILMTWREVAKMKNSLNCNLLIFDEILDSSLDATGTESFMKILNKMKQKCSIFIISHKSDQMADKFDNLLQFDKKNNFSKIKTEG